MRTLARGPGPIRTRVRTAPPAAWIRWPVAAIRRTALVNSPASVG